MSLGLVALCSLSTAALAQSSTPKTKSGENALEAAPEWRATAQAGLLLTTGNAFTTNWSGGLRATRKAGKNKMQLDLGGAFAKSAVYVATDADANGSIDESEYNRITQTTTQSWLAKGRYDRFLSARNALYTSVSASADKPAGRTLIGSGQLGYSRTLVTSPTHELVLESGYDFTYEDLSRAVSVSIHSLRVFAGYQSTLSPDTSLEISMEGLFNINELETSSGPVAEFKDTRFNSQVSLTTSIYGAVSFRFWFQSRFDDNPAPRPNPAVPFNSGFAPLANKLDTRTEAAIIVSFL